MPEDMSVRKAVAQLQEREQELQRARLAEIGQRALAFAKRRGFRTWAEFEKLLEEAFPAATGPVAVPPASAGQTAGDAPAGKPAVRQGPPPTFDKAAAAAMETNGVDEQLLVTFLFGDTGPVRKVTAADVERYLNG